MLKFSRALVCAFVLGGAVQAASAQTYSTGPIKIEQPWARATPGGAKVGGGYMTIVNTGSEADRLVGGSLPQAGKVEIHEMKMDGDVMQMRPVPGGLEIKPGQKVELAPNGYHVMFMDLREPFKQGEKLKGQLRFEKAGAIDVEYSVESIGAQSAPAHGH
jgi:copper(I)-binding protein